MVLGCALAENYAIGPENAQGFQFIKTKLVTQLLHLRLSAHFEHSVNQRQGTVSFTLDPERPSDLERSDGLWVIRAHPTDPAKSRVFYTCKIAAALPSFVLSMVQVCSTRPQ
jgi:hypothetical protein